MAEHSAGDVAGAARSLQKLRASISPRYFVVELLTGLAFLGCWLKFGDPVHEYPSMPLALVYAAFLAGLICATFIDFEHFIIPDEITFGGVAAGLVASFLLPSLQDTHAMRTGLLRSAVGAAVGAGPFMRFCVWANCCSGGRK